MQHKNDYSVIAFLANGTTKRWTYVHKLNGFALFLNQKHPNWEYINVYERRSRKYLKRFYKGAFIPPFLAILLSIGIYALTFISQPSVLTFNGFNNTATIQTVC